MQALKTNGLVMPPDFPSGAYEELINLVIAKRAKHDNYSDFVGAWHAVSFRFLAAVEYGDDFVASLAAFGTAPPHPQRYEQEKMLFGLFGSGMSVIEATIFALYSLGAMIPGAHFSLQTETDRRNVNLRVTEEAYLASFPNEKIAAALTALKMDPTFRDFAAARHTLTHREAPPRHHFVGGENDGTAKWGFRNWPLDASLAVNSRKLIGAALSNLLASANTFAIHRLV